MSSLSEDLQQRHSTEPSVQPDRPQAKKPVDLKSLPQLKVAHNSKSSPAAAQKASPRQLPADSKPQIASTGSTNLTVSLITPDADQTRVACQQVINDCDVQIAIAKSATPRHATFMIKGSAANVARAKQSLEEALQPHVHLKVDIPVFSRSALIGARGANLRAIEQRHHVKLDLRPKPASNWSFDTVSVDIAGGERAVEAAKADVLACVDEQRQVSSKRRFDTPEIALLVFENEPVLVGTFKDVVKQMQEVDAKAKTIEAEYIRVPCDTQGLDVPPRLLLPQQTVLLNQNTELYAPPASLKAAQQALAQFLATQDQSELDISRAHGGDAAHARMLVRYLAAVGALEQLSKEHGVRVEQPREFVYRLSGQSDAVQQARKLLVKQVNALSPATLGVVRGMRHALVRKRAAEAVKSLPKSIRATLGPSDELYLVFEDPGDDFAPSDAQIREQVAAAQQQLLFLTELAAQLARRSVNLSKQDVPFVLKPQGPEAAELRASFDVEITPDDDGVAVSGTREAVDDAVAAVPKLVKLGRAYAVLASHVEEFQIDAELVKQVIGRQGAQIQQFRQNFDVKMEVDKQGKVSVQGVEANVRECVKAVQDFQRRLRDEQVEELEIPAEFHARLIGPKGKYVNRLRDKHQCTIRFPDSKQESDIVYVRGPSRGVAAVKREFLELVEYEKQQSYVETFYVSSKVAPRLVGKEGIAINALRLETGTKIEIENAKDGEQAEVTVQGEQKRVRQAVKQLKQAADELMNTVQKEIDVPAEFRRRLVAARPQLVEEAGGDLEHANRALWVPALGRPGAVQLWGQQEAVAKLEKLVAAFVDDLKQKSAVVGELFVPESRLRRVAGAGGQTRRATEQQFNVLVEIPNGSGSGDQKLRVGVSGPSKESVNGAIEHLRAAALPESASQPFVAAGWSPQLRQQLLERFGVRASLEGDKSLPSPPDSGSATFSTAPRAVVCIEGKTEEDCKLAAEFLKEHTPTTVGYFVVPDKARGQIIGPNGRTIRQIREKTGCRVDIPREGPAVCVGTAAEVNAALQELSLLSA